MIACLGSRKDNLIKTIQTIGYECCPIECQEEISEKHDLVLVSGIQYKISEEFLNKPKHGVYGFHETDLPLGAGSAPLAWTLILSLPELVVTMFKMAKDFDTGSYICKERREIIISDDIHILELLRDQCINKLITNNVCKIMTNNYNLQIQYGTRVYFPRRYKHNSIICDDLAKMPLWYVWKTHIRACHNELYPCIYKDRKIIYKGVNNLDYRDLPVISKYLSFSGLLEFPFIFTIGNRFILLNLSNN